MFPEDDFESSHATKQQILRLIEYAKDELNKILNVAKTFDRVWHDGLIHKLDLLGNSKSSTLPIALYFGGRKFGVKVGNDFSTHR